MMMMTTILIIIIFMMMVTMMMMMMVFANIYRECVSSLPRRRHQTACGYTLELSNIIISIVITIIRNYDNLIIIITIMIIRRPVLQNHLLTDWFVRI